MSDTTITDTQPDEPVKLSDAELGAAIRTARKQTIAAQQAITALEDTIAKQRATNEAAIREAQRTLAARKAPIVAAAIDAYQKVIARVSDDQAQLDAITNDASEQLADMDNQLAALRQAQQDAEQQVADTIALADADG